MCVSESGDGWCHNLIRGVPVGNCTDGTGLVHTIARDTDLRGVDEQQERKEGCDG